MTRIFQVDAFTGKPFSGNPAAVIPLGESWPEDSLLKNLAMENNLSETAFIITTDDEYHIRWFTPGVEVDLCGHATLASAHVFFHHMEYPHETITFQSRSGPLSVTKEEELLAMNFPADSIKQVPVSEEMQAPFSEPVKEAWEGVSDLMLVFSSQDEIEAMNPDMLLLEQLDFRGVIVTAPGTQEDFVSRFFAPLVGVPEDPVTGSAHTTLTPYWSKRSGKDILIAAQLSARGGILKCRDLGTRVEIAGEAVTVFTGELSFPLG